MTKRIIAFVASLAVVIGLMNCGTSYAWFITTLEKKQSISVSVVSAAQTAKLTDLDSDEKTIIMPGDNLVNLDGQGAMLRINNGSTTDVQIRLSIEYTSYASGKAEQKIQAAEMISMLPLPQTSGQRTQTQVVLVISTIWATSMSRRA